jgi:DNA-binding NarL/FixJ family response regulator
MEATRLIKNKWPGIRIIMLTLYSGYQTEALAAGADAFLIKGCPDEELVETILASPNKASPKSLHSV